VRVDDHAHSLRFGFAARRLDLRVGHGLLTAVADARRSKYLDEVGALLLSFAHQLADLLRRAAGVDESHERSQNAWTGNEPSRDGLTQILVFRCSGTLNSRKASIERGHRVIHSA
jgi:hypothetical protein